MNKPGRNDPCPCGSGKKYKYCCYGKPDNVIPFPGGGQQEQDIFGGQTMMEQAGTPNAATESLKQLQQAIGGREFSSDEEMESFVNAFHAQQNSRPVDEFLGLSPDQMYWLTHSDFLQNEDVVTFHPEVCSVEELAEVPYIRMALHVLEFIRDRVKVKATAKLGCFPRVLVRDFHEAVAAQYRDYPFRVNNEEDVPSLERVRILLTMSGMIRKLHGSFLLTKKGEKIVQGNNLQQLYKELFLAYTDKFNWLYATGYDEALFYIQHACIFDLLILREKAVDPAPDGLLAEYFMDAFPMLLDQLPERSYTTPEKEFIHCFDFCFLERFAFLFGLVDRKLVDEKEPLSERVYRLLPLFGKLFTWKVH